MKPEHLVRYSRLVANAALLLTLCLLTITTTARAQGISPKPAGPNTLIGVVTDDVGKPMANVDVFVEGIRRRTLSRTDGSFRFDSISTGVYKVYARRIGFIGSVHDVSVRNDGGSVYLKLVQIRQALPSVQIVAARGGLSGIIADPTFTALSGVTVSVVGGGSRAKTDSAGAFYLPLKPGSYVLQLERSKFITQLLAATVPESGGRQIAAWMEYQNGRADHVYARNLFDLEQRIIRASTSTKIYTREDMENMGFKRVEQLANLAAARPLSPDCRVAVNGGPTALPLWELEAGDIEFVEITPSRLNATGIGPRGPTSIVAGPGTISTILEWKDASPTRTDATCGANVMVWMRR